MTGRNNAAMARVKWPCVGPLASHIDGFAGHLAGEGYAPSTIHEKYGFLADLSSWLEARQIALDTLDEGQLNQFHATRRSRGRARRGDAPTALQLLRYLRDLGCIPTVRQEIDRTPLGDLTRDYERFLHSLATNLLRRGASLEEIGQLLRHNQPTTTQIYAKVDIASLRGIALPWPGAAI